MSIRNEDVHLIATGSGEVRTSTGERIGEIKQVYLDNESGEPNWVTVKTGLFGMQESFVPLAQAEASGADVTVPYDKETIKNAPRLDAGGTLTPEEERRLYSHYFSAATVQADVDTDRDAGRDADLDTDRDADRRDEGSSSATGVRERMAGAFDRDRDDDERRDAPRVGDNDYDGTADTGGGGSRLRRYVVTEKVVPVSREEVPVDDPDRR
ncbi:MAG TPA: PRC-barrel domain-containing protein [Propionibacteriaceae bacterium]|nr:PRC-barrel domain-containing protein [Propionibacteriaceae bacterium]